MDIQFLILAFTLGAVAGMAITERDPTEALLNALRRRGVRFVVGALAVGFAAGIVWQIIG